PGSRVQTQHSAAEPGFSESPRDESSPGPPATYRADYSVSGGSGPLHVPVGSRNARNKQDLPPADDKTLTSRDKTCGPAHKTGPQASPAVRIPPSHPLP